MKGCFGALILLLTFPAALLGACAGAGGGVFFILLTGIGLSIYLIGAARTDSLREALELAESQKVWITKASAGDVEAIYECAVRYEKGEFGFPLDRELAKEHFTRAAKLGQLDAIERVKRFTDNAFDSINRPPKRFKRS